LLGAKLRLHGVFVCCGISEQGAAMLVWAWHGGLLLLHCSTYLVVILINVIQEIIHRLEKQFASEFDPLRDHSVPKSNLKFFKE